MVKRTHLGILWGTGKSGDKKRHGFRDSGKIMRRARACIFAHGSATALLSIGGQAGPPLLTHLLFRRFRFSQVDDEGKHS